MERYQGKIIVEGMAKGKIFTYLRDQYQVKKTEIDDPEKEIARYREAREQTIQQLGDAYDKAVDLVGAKSASVFEMQSILLKEGRLCGLVEKMIRDEKVSASYAVAEIGKQLAAEYRGSEEIWEKEEDMNIRELGKRLLKLLDSETYAIPLGTEPVILCARELLPGELLQLDRKHLAGLITETGTAESHTAVLASAMQLPYLTGVPFRLAWNGKEAALDGEKGQIYIEPNEDILKELEARKEKREKESEELAFYAEEQTVTLDGDRVHLYANISSLEEMDEVIRARAEGIGLFRSEFLYMGRETYPSEEEQFLCYKKIAERMQGKPVTIRTMDIGADKQIDYLRLDNEINPAMGYRGIRISLDREELFRTQLKAIYRAAVYGKLRVLYPMITCEEEVDQIQKIIEDIKEEMTAKGVKYGEVSQGVMIETPAAVIISDLLAKKVDFFSIGTNDLTQYVMAADRQNPKVSYLCDANHPAIFRIIQMIVQSGHKYHVPVSICGEIAGDPGMTQKLVSMGVDILSVTPNQILPIRKEVRNVSLRKSM